MTEEGECGCKKCGHTDLEECLHDRCRCCTNFEETMTNQEAA